MSRRLRAHRRLDTFAVVAVGLAVHALAACTVVERPAAVLIPVAVPAHDLPVGHQIRTGDLTTLALPRALVPEDVYTWPEEVVGRTVVERILAGEYVREERLLDPEIGSGDPPLILKRVWVPLPPGWGPERMSAGNFVDVIAACPDRAGVAVETLVRGTRVTAVREARPADDVAAAVQLSTSPLQAQRLTSALARCHLRLALVSDVEVSEVASNAR